MRLARVLGAIGRALISAGVIVLLFVAYQLWGTGLQHSQAQGNLEDELFELLDSDLAAEAEQVNEAVQAAQEEAAAAVAAVDDDEATVTSTATEEETADEIVEAALGEVSEEFLRVLYPETGASLARIQIPDINVDQIVVEGVEVEDLRKGPGHYPSTPNPGQAGNASIAGHRTTYGAPFHRVDELEPGASIFVTTIQGTFEYRVRGNDVGGELLGHFIVSPSDTWVLHDTGDNLLTLTACHPKYSARQRIIVQAELVGDPVPTIPRPDADGLEPVAVSISAGEQDERAEGEDLEQVMSDEVAADDDPSVDEDGEPIEVEGDEAAENEGEVADEATATDAETDADNETDDGLDDEDAVAATAAAAGGTASGEDGGADNSAAATEVADAGATDDIELTAGAATEDDFGEGLNGDRTKIRPAIMWGLAGGSVWLAAWFIGRRLQRKWTLYAIGLVAFAPTLWSCFVNIDQALPSY